MLTSEAERVGAVEAIVPRGSGRPVVVVFEAVLAGAVELVEPFEPPCRDTAPGFFQKVGSTED